MNFLRKLNVFDIVIALVILSVTFASVYFAFDPRESLAKKHDSMFSPTAKTIQNLIIEYVTKNKVNVNASFGYTKGSEIVNQLGAKSSFTDDTYIENNLDNFYIGKEKGSDATFHVCFIPQSKFLRDSRCNDSFVYTLNKDGTRTEVECNPDSAWQTGESPWVICNPN